MKHGAAVIGLGYWGPNLVRNLAQHPDIRLVGVCDLEESKVQQVAHRYPEIRLATTDYRHLLTDSDIELVCVATPPETHYHIVKEALQAGKHVLVEKPFVTDSSQGQELIALAQQNGLYLFVDHTFLFHPVIERVNQLIQSGELGDIYYFDSERVNLGLLQQQVDVIWDLAVHDLSILAFLFPDENFEVVSVAASRHVHPRLWDFAHLTLRSSTGFIAHIHVSWLSPVKIRKTIIGGSQKMVWWDDVNPIEKLRIYNTRIEVEQTPVPEDPFHPRYIKGDIVIPWIPNEEPLAREIAHVVRVLDGQEKPISDGMLGLRAVQLLEQASAMASSP